MSHQWLINNLIQVLTSGKDLESLSIFQLLMKIKKLHLCETLGLLWFSWPWSSHEWTHFSWAYAPASLTIIVIQTSLHPLKWFLWLQNLRAWSDFPVKLKHIPKVWLSSNIEMHLCTIQLRFSNWNPSTVENNGLFIGALKVQRDSKFPQQLS